MSCFGAQKLKIIIAMKSQAIPLIFSVLVCIFFLSVDSAIASSIDTDKEALISFKSSVNLPPSFWDQNSSPCFNWTGVTCKQFGNTQRVVSLHLSGLGLTGPITPHVGNLAKLQVLNLARNNLNGQIPPSLSNLSATLTSLNLGTNHLTGLIPSELGLLHKLKELGLAGNQLNGTVALSIYNMSSLVRFTVASNQLWGEIPTNIGETLPNLLYFRNCFNFFTGEIPESLQNISMIREIRMSNNFHEGPVPAGLGNLPFLEMYNIGFNRIVSYGDDGLNFITSLANSTSLNWLAINENRLEGVIPESIGNLSKTLSKLYMGGNRISGHIPASIGQLRNLTLLNVSYNSISGEIPSEIGQLQKLQMLGLARNNMSGSIPKSLGNLRKLNHIDLSGNYLIGHVPSAFAHFEKLLSMDLSSNLLSGPIPREILSLPSLSTILNMSNNLLNGTLPEIGLLQSIVTIDLSGNSLSGSIPSSIGKCTSLEELFMARNALSGSIPNALAEMRGLEILDLSSNQLSGSIPDELKNLNALSYLNLSFNHLEGVIPNGGVFARNISNVDVEGNPNLFQDWPCVKKSGSERRKVLVLVLIIAVLAALVFILVIGWWVYVRNNKGSSGCKSTVRETPSDLLIKGQHQMVTYEELRGATGNFKLENLIGSGGFGFVYKGCVREGTEVAVKVLDTKMTASLKSFLAECEALRSVRHRNLVKLITSCSSLDFKNMEFLALVYEYMSNGSLEDWIKGKRKKADGGGLSIVERLNIVIDVACGLDYLHHDCEVPVIHCDLKPSNILLDEDMNAKIGDFGLAKLLIERTRSEDQHCLSSTNVLNGSIGYIPPEYGFGQKPSTSGDAYSFGVMLLEVFTGRSPTDERFTGDENLMRWVHSAFPHNMIDVVDSELLELIMPSNEDIIPEAQHNCLTPIIEVGLSCTCDLPERRISLRDALYKLKTARQSLFNPNHLESVKKQ